MLGPVGELDERRQLLAPGTQNQKPRRSVRACEGTSMTAGPSRGRFANFVPVCLGPILQDLDEEMSREAEVCCGFAARCDGEQGRPKTGRIY